MVILKTFNDRDKKDVLVFLQEHSFETQPLNSFMTSPHKCRVS